MSKIETAETIAGLRVVSADALLENRADLRGYPHRYLAIHSYVRIQGEGMRKAMAAIEFLERFGWSLVNILEMDNQIYAMMRQPEAR